MSDLIRELEALRVQPGEILIVRLPEDTDEGAVDGLHGLLAEVWLGGRSLIFVGEVEFAVAESDGG